MADGPNKMFDEFAKLMTDAAGVAQGMRNEGETIFKAQAERMFNSLDIVKRDDFDAVREMAANARDENDKLHELVTKLEERISALEGKKKPASKSAATAKSTKAGK